ncbi:serine/threonine-protein kinase [Engelhardtia mirabilis]|uniref:Serine/threonine-protein kinase PknB n=1 Tax=Engelhardtia mirabilis TaxID=2528011 RepID=A0A518BDG3_9BACT|nr:Serine/threonine-protein kinase PknB [Planctomycetes bacterium Pla133]QDU99357.1 Serine/threonine-protein kinase PknB [Planctomycetes bacterium Pla86]
MTEAQDTPTRDRVALRVLEALAADRAAGGLKSLDHYRSKFPGHADLVAREFADFGQPRPAEPGRSTVRRFGPYRLVELLGRGGQGAVYRAVDTRLGRSVALKLLPGTPLGDDDRPPSLLARELEALTRLDHPGVAGVLEAGTIDGSAFIATRFVPGETLAARLVRWREEGPPPVEQRVELVARIAEALAAAHGARVVHRDVKPSNVVLDTADRPVLIDFGLARTVDSNLPTMTVTGDVIGTPRYLAPERLAGRGGDDPRGDVWALGVLLFEVIALEPPFDGPTVEALARGIERDEPTPLRRLAASTVHGGLGLLGRDLDGVVAVALEKRIDRRYRDAGALARDLRRLLRGEPIEARPPGRLGRAARWMARNPALTAIFVLLGVLAAGAGLAAWKLDAVARSERSARFEAQAGVARADADRARLLLAGDAIGRFTAAGERLAGVGPALVELAAAGASLEHLDLPELHALRSDAVAALASMDLVERPTAELGGLGVVQVDPGGQVAVAMTIAPTSGRLVLEASSVDGDQDRSDCLEGIRTTSDLLAVGPGAELLAFRVDGQLVVEGSGRAAQALDLRGAARRAGLGDAATFPTVEWASFSSRAGVAAVLAAGAWALVDPASGECFAASRWDDGTYRFGVFSPDGDWFAAPGGGSTVLLVDVPAAQESSEYEPPEFDFGRGPVLAALPFAGPDRAPQLAVIIESERGFELLLADATGAGRTLVQLTGTGNGPPVIAVDPSGTVLAAVAGESLVVIRVADGRVLHRSYFEPVGGFEVFKLREASEGLELLVYRRSAALSRYLLTTPLVFEEPAAQPLEPSTDPGPLATHLLDPLGGELFDSRAGVRPKQVVFSDDPELPLDLGRPGVALRSPGGRPGDSVLAPAALPPRAASRQLMIGGPKLVGVVCVWERGRSEPLFSVEVEPLITGGALALAADGSLLAVSEITGRTRLFDVEAQRELLAFDLAPPAAARMEFAQDGDLVVLDAAGRTRRVRIDRLRQALGEIDLDW